MRHHPGESVAGAAFQCDCGLRPVDLTGLVLAAKIGITRPAFRVVAGRSVEERFKSVRGYSLIEPPAMPPIDPPPQPPASHFA